MPGVWHSYCTPRCAPPALQSAALRSRPTGASLPADHASLPADRTSILLPPAVDPDPTAFGPGDLA